jgi:VanZ family protein
MKAHPISSFISGLKLQNVTVVAAWAALACISAMTLSPLRLRPIVTTDPTFERFFSFAMLGILFAIGYPRRLRLAAFIVVAAAVGLEVAQHLTPDRHGELPDFLEKAAGGLCGVALGQFAIRYLPRKTG